MTQHHLAIAMEYAPGGDLSEYVDACKRAGVSPHIRIAIPTRGLFCAHGSGVAVCSRGPFVIAQERHNVLCSWVGYRRQMRAGSSSSSSLPSTTATGWVSPIVISRFVRCTATTMLLLLIGCPCGRHNMHSKRSVLTCGKVSTQ